MSKKLKHRIEDLMNRAVSEKVFEACKHSLEMHKLMASFNMTAEAEEKMEAVIVEDLISSLAGDEAVLEFSDIAIKNLGVRKGIESLKNDSSLNNMPLFYVIEKLGPLTSHPEWLVYEQFISALAPFDFEPKVKEVLENVKKNANLYKEDIRIHQAVSESKKSRSNYITSFLQDEIEEYLIRKTPTNRASLLEKLNKYIFDPSIKRLYNVIIESSDKFEIAATSKDAFVKNVYSPVIVTSESETFVINGKPYKKQGDNVTPLTEGEITYLPENFVAVANFINQPNVEVGNNTIKIFYKDKKVVIKESASQELSITINEKKTSVEEFSKVFLSSGLYNSAEMHLLRTVQSIVESWNTICEIDFVKSIYSKHYPNRRADVFRCGNTMHINTVDTLMNEELFYENCTAHQSINHIKEFVNYDLSLTFSDLMSPERKRMDILERERAEYAEAIAYLENRRTMLESQEESISNSPEIKEIISAITEEVNILKKSYFDAQSQIISLNKISEGAGATVGDTAEYLKKK